MLILINFLIKSSTNHCMKLGKWKQILNNLTIKITAFSSTNTQIGIIEHHTYKLYFLTDCFHWRVYWEQFLRPPKNCLKKYILVNVEVLDLINYLLTIEKLSPVF